MSWKIRIAKEAAKHFSRIPRDKRDQLTHAIDQMQHDPLQGDARPIKSGKFKGALRKRVGRYRIIFALDPPRHLIEIAAILLRDKKTYR